MMESELQRLVETHLDRLGYTWFHDNDSRRNRPGLPDIVAVGRKVLFIELKSDTGALKPDQHKWMYALQDAGAIYRLWRPEDWRTGHIQNELFWHSTK